MHCVLVFALMEFNLNTVFMIDSCTMFLSRLDLSAGQDKGSWRISCLLTYLEIEERHNLARITSRGVIVTCMQSMHLTDYCVWEFTVIIKRTGIKFGHLKIKSLSRYVKSVIKISIYLVAKFPSTKTCLHEVYVDLNYVNFHDYFCMNKKSYQ